MANIQAIFFCRL